MIDLTPSKLQPSNSSLNHHLTLPQTYLIALIQNHFHPSSNLNQSNKSIHQILYQNWKSLFKDINSNYSTSINHSYPPSRPSSSSSSSPSSNSHNQLSKSSGSVQNHSSPPAWLHFVAGGLGGMCGATLTAPFDLVKTRLQSSTYYPNHLTHARLSFTSSYPNQSRSIRLSHPNRLFYHFVDTGKIIGNIHRTEGSQALFRGLGPTLVGAIPARAINFCVYGNGKEFYSRLLIPNLTDSSSLVHICSAITAGIATATATNPIWVVKTRLQLDQPSSSPSIPQVIQTSPTQTVPRPHSHTTIALEQSKYSNRSSFLSRSIGTSLQCISKIYHQEGILGFYRGLSASYLGVAEGTIQWTLYEKFKRWGSPFNTGSSDGETETWISKMFAAGAAKLIATGITYPHEVIRTRMRQKPPPPPLQPKYSGLYSTFKVILVEEGPKAFYGGLSPHLLRVVPNAIVMYTVYEAVMSLSRPTILV